MNNCTEVNHMYKQYQDFHALSDVSFQIVQGELFSLLGPNGAGKSTMINILSTLLPFQNGEAFVCGLQVGKDDYEIRRHIGIVFQESVLDDRLSARENLSLRAKLYYKKKVDIQQAVVRSAEAVSAMEFIDRPYGKLSGGQKRRVDIARALLHQPDVLFLDEPTTGLDPRARHDLWTCILALQKAWGTTILLTTHYMEEASVSNHIVMLDHGHILAQGTPASLKEQYSCNTLDEVFLTIHPQEAC